MHGKKQFLGLFLLGALLTVICGCSEGDMGRVKGQVKLNGDPLPDATVTFQPAKGRPSIAVTDKNGEYELMYKAGQPGAKVGSYKVTITTFRSTEDKVFPERVPEKYNKKSELTAEVKPGSNDIDFDLESK